MKVIAGGLYNELTMSMARTSILFLSVREELSCIQLFHYELTLHCSTVVMWSLCIKQESFQGYEGGYAKVQNLPPGPVCIIMLRGLAWHL